MRKTNVFWLLWPDVLKPFMADRLEIITIDGPSGVGKSTVSRKVAAVLGYTYLDTGAMYRGVALYLLRHQVTEPSEAVKVLETLDLELLPAPDEFGDVGVRLNGEDVSGEIRTPAISMHASRVSAWPAVRQKLTELQRILGARAKIVAEGRDTGTVVFPQAAHKFFLDARPEERARRRILQLQLRGEEVNEAEILALTIERDKNDRERAIAPLCQATDAVLIDTTVIDLDEVARRILAVLAVDQQNRRG